MNLRSRVLQLRLAATRTPFWASTLATIGLILAGVLVSTMLLGAWGGDGGHGSGGGHRSGDDTMMTTDGGRGGHGSRDRTDRGGDHGSRDRGDHGSPDDTGMHQGGG